MTPSEVIVHYSVFEAVIGQNDNTIVNSIVDGSVPPEAWIALADGIREKVAQVRKFRIEQVKSQLQSLAAEGISVNDLIERKKAVPIYKDPTTGKTWSGYGRLPKWMADLIANGASKESFRIVPLETVEETPETTPETPETPETPVHTTVL